MLFNGLLDDGVITEAEKKGSNCRARIFQNDFKLCFNKNGDQQKILGPCCSDKLFEKVRSSMGWVICFVTKYWHSLKFGEFSYNKLCEEFKHFQAIIN